jgi:5-hydroxyisourate hydrolase-like protein (transthyretin family)
VIGKRQIRLNVDLRHVTGKTVARFLQVRTEAATACALEPGYGRTGVGQYTLQLHRGDYFRNTMKTSTALRNSESPLADPLRTIGFDERAI